MHDVCFVVPGTRTRPALNGQIDFVLVHPRQGLLVIEAKGGRYDVAEGSWFTYPSGRRERMERSPFAQAMSNRYALTDHITAQTGLRGLPAGHAVVFTDGAPRGHLGPEAPSAITLDGGALKDIASAIARVCAHWFAGPSSGLSDTEFTELMAVIAPTATVVADRKYTVDVTLIDVRSLTERQIELTDEQLQVVEATTSHAHVAVLGSAGTGKTVIATRRAQQLAGQGRRVLLIADQRYLHDALRRQVGLKHANIVLGTPEEVISILEERIAAPKPDAPLWERYLTVAEAGEVFDVVIVDEAQSLDDEVLEALRSLGRSAFHTYADPYQRDAAGMWRPPGAETSFWLTRNCRNSLSIAKLVAKLSGSFPPQEGASGPRPRFVPIRPERSEVVGQACEAVTEILEHVAAQDVAVLTCEPDIRELRAGLVKSGVRIARKPGDDGITLLPAQEFRGCEAPVVILVAGADHPCGEDGTTRHYVAASRAVAELIVIADRDTWSPYLHLMDET